MKGTTDLELIEHGSPFTWGKVIRTHYVGDFVFVEYHPWIVIGSMVRVGEPDTSKKQFHIYVNGKSTSHAADTIDTALIEALTIKYQGRNSQASEFIARLLEIKN